MNLVQRFGITSKNAWIHKWNSSAAFTDQDNISSDYADELFQLYVNRIYNGTIINKYNHKMETILQPKEILDRATCCTIIMRTFK